MRISIPNKVVGVHNKTSTHRVYDPDEALGDIQPGQPKPPKKKHGCGTIGKILVAVVAAAVTYFVTRSLQAALKVAEIVGTTAATAATVATAVVGGAIGSAVSQGVGIALGVQDRFSWKSVAMSAISAGLTGPASSVSGFVEGAIRGAAINAATQGIAIATGLQKRFDWTGVAVAAVAGGVMSRLDPVLPGFKAPALSPAGLMHSALSGAAGAVAGAATRSLLTGTNFGDNILAALPDVIGATAGNAIGGAILQRAADAAAARARGDQMLADVRQTMADTQATIDNIGRRSSLSLYGDGSGSSYAGTIGGGSGSLILVGGPGSDALEAKLFSRSYTIENLRLGVNSGYSDEISIASRQSGLPPQTVAAIINAEAAKLRGGLWDPNSANSSTTARGLTQFLKGTWLGEGNIQGSYLNDRARSIGYLGDKLNIRPDSEESFLNLRFNSQDSISAAADMAARNINFLSSKGLILNADPGALAKYAYIAHHEGRAGAVGFLTGALRISEGTFKANVPAERRGDLLRQYGNNRNLAYREYMSSYIDQRVDVRAFMANSAGVMVPPTHSLYRNGGR